MDLLSKVSAELFLELKDTHTVNILLCFLLNRLNKPVTESQLYEIAVGNDIINYFFYTEALEMLINNQTILREVVDGNEVLILSPKGRAGAEEFKRIVPKSFRDRILSCALRFFAKLKRYSEVSCQIIPLSGGYYVCLSILDKTADLMELKIFAPDYDQALIIKEKVMLNPTDFYARIIGYALDNVEEEYNLD